MVTLEELIETLKEILNLDNENYGANVYIGGKYLLSGDQTKMMHIL